MIYSIVLQQAEHWSHGSWRERVGKKFKSLCDCLFVVNVLTSTDSQQLLFLILLVSNFEGFFPQQTFRDLLKVNFFFFLLRFGRSLQVWTSFYFVFCFLFLFIVFYKIKKKKFHKREGRHSLLV